jgi:hypothetical protein
MVEVNTTMLHGLHINKAVIVPADETFASGCGRPDSEAKR